MSSYLDKINKFDLYGKNNFQGTVDLSKSWKRISFRMFENSVMICVISSFESLHRNVQKVTNAHSNNVRRDSQHSSLTTHFSVSSVWSWQSEPSSGYCLTYRSLDLIPIPQDTLQADQLIHSDIMHVDGSVHRKKKKQAATDAIRRTSEHFISFFPFSLWGYR